MGRWYSQNTLTEEFDFFMWALLLFLLPGIKHVGRPLKMTGVREGQECLAFLRSHVLCRYKRTCTASGVRRLNTEDEMSVPMFVLYILCFLFKCHICAQTTNVTWTRAGRFTPFNDSTYHWSLCIPIVDTGVPKDWHMNNTFACI